MGAGVVYDPQIDGRHVTFGVSGKLYKGSLLMYDHQTESLWSQLKSEAIAGPLTGSKLKTIPHLQTTWRKWRQLHPNTLVLSPGTGFDRDYRADPYREYSESPHLPQDLKIPKSRYKLLNKERVIGIQINGVSKAYPLSVLKREPEVRDEVGGRRIVIRYDGKNRTAEVLSEKGEHIPSVNVFWFAWYTFHPDTLVYGR